MPSSKDINVVFDNKGKEITKMYCVCPNLAIKTFFNHIEGVSSARFEHWAYTRSLDNTYDKKDLGVFTRQQVLAAGDQPLVEPIEWPPPEKQVPVGVVAKPVKNKAKEPSKPSMFSRAKQLLSAELNKEKAISALVSEFPETSSKRIRMLVHSAAAIVKKQGEGKGEQTRKET